MKILFVLILSVSVSGCLWQSVNQYDLNDAIRICGKQENIAHIRANYAGHEIVTCMNGTEKYLHLNN